MKEREALKLPIDDELERFLKRLIGQNNKI